MNKKIFRIIFLIFTFLFLNMSFNSINTQAAGINGLPEEVYSNAGWGQKAGYWAVINYGSDYIGDIEVTIDIQPEAIANTDVQVIGIMETGHTDEAVYYKRNIDAGFSTRVNYTMNNSAYGEKDIAILLLREISPNPTDNLIVDKIIIDVNQKRNISEFTEEDILITPAVPDDVLAMSPYEIKIGLNPDTIEGAIEDYVLKSVTYKLMSVNTTFAYNAIGTGEINEYYYKVAQNGIYEIVVEDVFGYTVTKYITINNLKDPDIMIELTPECVTYVNHAYAVDVDVIFYESNHILSSSELSVLEVTSSTGTKSIKEDMFFTVTDNGLYTVYARTLNGSEASIDFLVTNMDTEDPYAQVASNLVVYTESLALFQPKNEIFVYDNITEGEDIIVELQFFTVDDEGNINQLYPNVGDRYKNYLYSVRDMIIRYKVIDLAGNYVLLDTYVKAIDDTKPTIEKTIDRTFMYINDMKPDEDTVKEMFGLNIKDNSIYEGTKWTFSYEVDTSLLPYNEEGRLNLLGEYPIFITAVDEAGNESDYITVTIEVRARLITVEADELYIVYGDPMIPITYHCVTREGENVDCRDELLEGDSIRGELYVLNAQYVGDYQIYYDNISIPSELYYLQYGNVDTFSILHRTLKIVAEHKEKDYKDPEPELTWYIDESVCDPDSANYEETYRCDLVYGDSLVGEIQRDMRTHTIGEYTYNNEEVLYDVDNTILPRSITQGTLSVLELYDGGVVGGNYRIDFQNAEFWIWPKDVNAYVERASKVYGEFDPTYVLRSCSGKEPIHSMSALECMSEISMVLKRSVEGETVVSDERGNYLDYYEINGTALNRNYEVVVYPSYLTIIRRNLSISVVGDLDLNEQPTGKYTIYYEDDIPSVEVYDSSSGDATGLVENGDLNIHDRFHYGEAEIYEGEQLVVDYVSGVGAYRIRKGTIMVVDQLGVDAEYNYNITFNEGVLEVIKKTIFIKIIKELTKVYGDNDAYFTTEDLAGYGKHIILEANGRYIIEITATQLIGEEPYIPRDNEKMKYHLIREEGIYVGNYDISIEKLEGCDNYWVYLYEEYKYTITHRDMSIDIHDKTIIFKDVATGFTYDEEKARASLQYNDTLEGEPGVDEYKNVGLYRIHMGSIKVVDETGKDVSFNYKFTVKEGTLTIIQREIVIMVSPDQSKVYGVNDPLLLFSVFHNGQEETMEEGEYKGKLGREEGEEPGSYKVNIGTFEIELNGFDEFNTPIGNYLITKFDDTHKFIINKKDIMISARSVSAFYGEEYQLLVDTNGQLAYNQALKIDGEIIQDEIVGELVVLPEVNGVGTYTISTSFLKIIRSKTGQDITDKYYNFTHSDGVLEILPRKIYITPKLGQSKIYGEDDTPIEFDYYPNLIGEDVFVGELARKPIKVNGKEVTQNVGTYPIVKGTLDVNRNYDLIVNENITYAILHRTLNLIAHDITIEHGDYYELTYEINNGGGSNGCEGLEGNYAYCNSSIGVYDKIHGELNLDRIYEGYGVYTIRGDNLRIDNISNYSYTFTTGLLVVNKKIVYITPHASNLSKVYGDEDPSFTFDSSVISMYTGKLIRDEGVNVGRYKIHLGTLNFGDDYELRLGEINPLTEKYEAKEYFFEIRPRAIGIMALNAQKLFKQKDPKLIYKVTSGKLIGEDKFTGQLSRDPGEDVGQYVIRQGELKLTANYTILFTEGILTIEYAPITEIIIETLTENLNQEVNSETPITLFARFNEGANQDNIKDIVWTITKVYGNGDTVEWPGLEKNPINNTVTFTPEGVGKYIIKASYNNISAEEVANVIAVYIGNIYIEYDGLGATTQKLGATENVRYKAILSGAVNPEATIQWLIDGKVVQSNSVSDLKFTYNPKDLLVGAHIVQAQIGSKLSDSLTLTIINNDPPVITLLGDGDCLDVCVVEVLREEYIEYGATVIDDIDGDITPSLVIAGTVDSKKIGTYYIRYTATDSHGNNAVAVYRQVIVKDTIGPTITLNGNSEITLMYGTPYEELGAVAIDEYDGYVEVFIDNPIIIDKVGEYIVTYRAYDKSGNVNPVPVKRKVKIVDNVPPVVTLLGDSFMHVEVYNEFEDPGVLVEDNVDGRKVELATSIYYGTQLVDFLDTSKLGVYYLRYEILDSSNNPGITQIRTVEVVDTTAPVITLKGTNPHIVRYAYPNINYVEPGAVATDNYDEYVEVIITGELGSELGTYIISYNAVDSRGNEAKTVTRQVVVVDVDEPVIYFYDDVCPQYMTIEAMYEEYDFRCDAAGYGLDIEDNYQEADKTELYKRLVVTGSVDNTKVGTYVISYDVKDMQGLSAVTLRRYVTVVDTTAPVITLQGGDAEDGHSQVVEVFESYEELGATVYDRYDEYHELEVEILINHNINVMKLGEYMVTYNATDSNGNKAAPVIRKVYVKDTTPPELTLIGDEYIVVERGTIYVDHGATAHDNYDGPIPFERIVARNVPTGMNLGKYEIVYSVADSSGNVGEIIRIVDVIDTIPPIVLGVIDGTYYKEPVSIYFIPTANTDEKIRGWLNGIEIESPYYLDKEGIYELHAEDDAGNSTDIWFSIDTTPPEILGVKDGEYTNREKVEVYSNEQIKYYMYRYGNGDWITSTNQILEFTVEGTYTLRAVDMADNESNTISFVIDRTKPEYKLIGASNKGITNINVSLEIEEYATAVVNAHYNIPTIYNFTEEGYYSVTIRDLAGNEVVLQFVINKDKKVTVNDKIVTILGQYGADGGLQISGNYPRNSGYLLVIPNIDGTFTYVSGKMFSEQEYQTLVKGGVAEFSVTETDDTYMFAAFVVSLDELNKFGSQTVEGDEEDDENKLWYGIAVIFVVFVLFFIYLFFIKRRNKQEEEEETEEETIIDDFY